MDRPIHNQNPFDPADAGSRPFPLFDRWFKKASATDSNNAAVIALATATPEARPSLRLILLKEYSEAESDAYFATRPRESQLSAWASPQSSIIKQPVTLDKLRERFSNDPIPRPANWGGYRLIPETFEFWQGRANRLHDRIRFTQTADDWKIDRLAP